MFHRGGFDRVPCRVGPGAGPGLSTKAGPARAGRRPLKPPPRTGAGVEAALAAGCQPPRPPKPKKAAARVLRLRGRHVTGRHRDQADLQSGHGEAFDGDGPQPRLAAAGGAACGADLAPPSLPAALCTAGDACTWKPGTRTGTPPPQVPLYSGVGFRLVGPSPVVHGADPWIEFAYSLGRKDGGAGGDE